jgi:hypothetical protein
MFLSYSQALLINTSVTLKLVHDFFLPHP